jgi:ABC-type lipoprotein release transport system permease subunit
MAILAVLTLLTLAAGLYPAYKAGHTAPLDSIRDL